MKKNRAPKKNSIPVLDAHNDSLILREVRDDPLTFSARDPAYQADGARLKRGGIKATFVMVGDKDIRQSLRLIDAVHCMAETQPSSFALCTNAADVRRALRARRLALIMSIEGQSMFNEDPANIRLWHRMGVRVMSLTHGEGRFGGPPTALQQDTAHGSHLSESERSILFRQSKGLTAFARESLREMGRLKVIVDLAHTNDKAFFEALECAAGPVAVTHGNTYALCPHARNCTDEMLRALAARGGVIGICAFKCFVDVMQPSLARMADHFEHALEVMGENHVGFGSDFDGIPLHEELVIPDAAAVPALWRELRKRGITERVIRKIAFENFMRLLQ